MRTLTRQEIIDLLYGCTVLGTGGGGNLSAGVEMIEKDIAEGRRLRIMDLEELSDEAWIATPYGCGAPRGEDEEEDPKFRELPHLNDSAAVLAFQRMEKYIGSKFEAVSSTELGGQNTAEALHIACLLDVPVIDADPAGRSVPELQHSTYFVKGLPIYPLAVATNFGETVILENVCNDFRAEDIIRAIAVASGNEVGVVDHVTTGDKYKASVIPGAHSYAMKIGRILRESKENGSDAAIAIAESCGGRVLFRGETNKIDIKTKGGFNIGEFSLKGTGEFAGEEYRIMVKNENMVSYRNGRADVMIPDLICMLDEKNEPITTPNFSIGTRMNIVGLPAPRMWTTPEGLAVFGPRAVGYDLDYMPMEKE